MSWTSPFVEPKAAPDGLCPGDEHGGARLKQLLSQLGAQGKKTFRYSKVHPAEISEELLKTLGFRSAGAHLLYAAKARSA